MKRFVTIVLLLLGVAPLLRAQQEDEGDLFAVAYAGQKPVISDFVTAILSQEDLGESLNEMKANWELYQAGKALPEGRSFTVDTKNGYLRYDTSDQDEDGIVYSSLIEFCYWNFSDGRHKLVAENTVCCMDGKPYMGQFSGLSFYLYDGKSREMGFTSGYDLGLDFDIPEDTDLMVHQLPRTGKTILYQFFAPSGNLSRKATWNGKMFIIE